MGSVWVWTESTQLNKSGEWERLMKDVYLPYDEVVRVFPNPERFKTCYVEDWRERVKTVDRDYVVVDKPPLLPCFAKVSNGRETLSQCVKEGLHLREWGGANNVITDEMRPCHEIDDEASGLIVLARHDKAVKYFDECLENKTVAFEFVALCTKKPEKGVYRHFFNNGKKMNGQAKPALFDEIPHGQIKFQSDYQDWDYCEMQVLATADLSGGCAAVRIRTQGTGFNERIRAQLALMSCPVLNDEDILARTPQEVARKAGLTPDLPALNWQAPNASEEGGEGDGANGGRILRSTGLPALGGHVDEETLRGPYGRKLQLLPNAQKMVEKGVSQAPRKTVPVALHLARVEWGGRTVTCAPPPYWPEGAAAAVAVKLTDTDVRANIAAWLTTQGGKCRMGALGSRFGVNKPWLMKNFLHDEAAALVFVSETSKKDFESATRVKRGRKAEYVGPTSDEKFSVRKLRNRKLMEEYVPVEEWGFTAAPKYKDVKHGRVKKIDQGL